MDSYRVKFEKLSKEYEEIIKKNYALMFKSNHLKVMVKDLRSKRNLLVSRLDDYGDKYMDEIEKINKCINEKLQGLGNTSHRINLLDKKIKTSIIQTSNYIDHNNSITHATDLKYDDISCNKEKKCNSTNVCQTTPSTNNLPTILKLNNGNDSSQTKNGTLAKLEIQKNYDIATSNVNDLNLINIPQINLKIKREKGIGERKKRFKTKSLKAHKYQLVPKISQYNTITPVPIACLQPIISSNTGTYMINSNHTLQTNQSFYSFVTQGNVILVGNSSQLSQLGQRKLAPISLNKPYLFPPMISSVLQPYSFHNNSHNFKMGVTKANPTITNNLINLPFSILPQPKNVSKTQPINPRSTFQNAAIPMYTPSLLKCGTLQTPLSNFPIKNPILFQNSSQPPVNTTFGNYHDYLDSLLNKAVVSNFISDGTNQALLASNLQISHVNSHLNNINKGTTQNTTKTKTKVILPKLTS